MSSCHASCYHCFSFVIFPDLRPTILQNEPMADKLLKLLLPSLKFDFCDLSGFIGLDSTSVSLILLILATMLFYLIPLDDLVAFFVLFSLMLSFFSFLFSFLLDDY